MDEGRTVVPRLSQHERGLSQRHGGAATHDTSTSEIAFTRADYGIPKNEYAVKVGDLQWVRIPPGQSVARPEATRAAQEVTNALKFFGVTGHFR